MSDPRSTLTFIGHHAAEQSFLDSFNSGRLHHAWLLAGPRGIGKATFAWRVARFLLSAAPKGSDGLFGRECPISLTVANDDPIVAQINARSVIGLAVLERLENEKTGKLATSISVEQVRALVPVMGTQVEPGAWRVVIIDAVDDLNRNGSNALLKMLEEPPERTLFLLVSHQPKKLLPTIRSRCRRVDMQMLSTTDVGAVLAAHDINDPVLISLADGAPGQALRYTGLDLKPLSAAIESAMAGQFSFTDQLQLSESMTRPDAAARYEAFLDLAQRAIVLRLKSLARSGRKVETNLELWDKVRTLVGPAQVLNDDPKLVVLSLLGLLPQISV